MRCTCCDKRLSSYEATIKHGTTGAYLDTCLKCLDGLGIPVMGNEETDDGDTISVDEYNEHCIRLDTWSDGPEHDDT
jgi:hypothetical protein